MPDTDPNKPDSTGFPDVSKNNEDVIKKMAAQDISGQSTIPDINSGTGDALDAIFQNVQKPDPEAEAKVAVEKEAADKKAAEDKAAAEDPEKKAEAEKAAADAAQRADAERKRAEELFKDTPQLPQGASPKSAEAFATVKIKAAQEISARDQKITDLETKVKDYEAKLQNPVPDEVQKELEEHRAWRLKLDIDADPKFKEFDKKASSAREFVYAQLKRSPKITESIIDSIRKYGGPENVDMTNIFEVIADPTTQRMIESKLADIESIKFDKDNAIKAAKENVTEYVSQREKDWKDGAQTHNRQTTELLNKQILPKLDYVHKKDVPANADAATKASIEAHNKKATEMQSHIAKALEDDTPEMRAVMIAGMVHLLHLRPMLDAEKARADKLALDLKEATEKLDKLKNASVSRLRESAAPPNGKLPAANEDKYKFHVPAGQSIDDIAKQVQEERARASGAGA